MKITKEQISQIPELLNKGWKYQAIADEFGVAVTTIRYWVRIMRRDGVKVNTKGGPAPIKFNPDGTIK